MVFRDRVRSALSTLTKERTPGAVIHACGYGQGSGHDLRHEHRGGGTSQQFLLGYHRGWLQVREFHVRYLAEAVRRTQIRKQKRGI